MPDDGLLAAASLLFGLGDALGDGESAAAAAAVPAGKKKMGRPKKTQGRGKKNLRLSSVKKGREGSIKWKKRAGKLNARARMMASLTPPSLPDDEPSTISEKDIRSAIAVIFKREYLGANLGEWASISLSVSKQLKCGPRLVLRVLAKIEEGSPAEARLRLGL